ncbi:MAG: adenylate/guanylate cyclase domain-containing protein [Beijerinckiaceae bacterium]|nr:adenylate/guanylate cyclase domain-containing protein [Beijerinckiaceae bacterium]
MALPVVLILAGCSVCVTQISIVEALRNLVFDTYQRLSPRERGAENPVAIIDIDDESLQKIGQWPWPRSTLAKLSDRLAQGGAVAAGYDILFSEPDRLSPERLVEQLPPSPQRTEIAELLSLAGLKNDALFARSLARLPSVLGFVTTAKAGGTPDRVGVAFGGDDPRVWLPHFIGAVLPIPELATSGAAIGSIVFIPDRDLIVRKVNLLVNVGPDPASGTILPSLDAALLRDAQGASTLIVKSSNASGQQAFGVQSGVTDVRIGALSIPTDRTGAVRIRFARNDPGRRTPAWMLLADDEAEKLFERKTFEGKIILIGSSATALADVRSTPLETVVPGIDIHAELIENILEGVQLSRPDYVGGLEAVVLVCACLAALLFSRRMSPAYSAGGVLVLAAALWVGSFFLFRDAALLVDALVPSSTMIAVFGVSTVSQYRRSVRERKQIRGAFSRYVAPGVVASLEKNPAQLQLGGETRTVSIMFCDARNFTRRSETLDAAGVVHFLNSLHTPLTACVLDSAGTIDKYIGDGLMAFWNAPHDVPDHASKACAAALAMMAKVPQIDRQLAEEAAAEGRPHIPLGIGIGINSGPSFVGNMGSDQRFDYSVVGDAVNVAARFESATKEYGVDIIVSAETAREAPDHLFVKLDGIALKGKSEPVQAFALHGPRPATPDTTFDRFTGRHEAALAALNAGDVAAKASILALADDLHGARYRKLYDLWLERFDITRNDKDRLSS